MSIILPALAVAFAAFCVWLAVRIVNRRSRPGRHFFIIAPLVLLLAYPLSVGPLNWLMTRELLPGWAMVPLTLIYLPLNLVTSNFPDSEAWYAKLWFWYVDLWSADVYR